MNHIFSEQAIRDLVGSVYLQRGRLYFNQCRVKNITFTDDRIVGQVRGGEGNLYRTSLTLDEKEVIDSACSCPMDYDCKHVAALYLQAMEDYEKGGKKVPDSSLPEWQKELEFRLRGNGVVVKNKLEIALVLEPEYDYMEHKSSLRLKVRPKLFDSGTGKSSFSKIRWRDAGYPASLSLPASHVGLFRRLAMAVGSHWNSGEWLTVRGDDADHFWHVIREHRKCGVNLAGFKAENHVRVSDSPLKMGLVLGKQKEGLVLRNSFRTDEAEIPVDRVLLVGKPAVFAIVKEGLSFSLHPLEPAADRKAIPEWLEPVQIPKENAGVFVETFLPKLVRKYEVRSFVPDITIPEVVRPVLEMEVKKLCRDGIEVCTGFRYPSAIGNTVNMSDPEEEKILSEDLLQKLSDADPFFGGVFRNGDPSLPPVRSAARLQGVDAAKFVRQALPALKKDAGLRLTVADDLPDFTLDETPPSVEFEITENASENDWFDLKIRVAIQGEEVLFEDIFRALLADDEHFFTESGRYFPLRVPAFEKLRELILEAKSLRDVGKEGIRLTRFQAGLWEELVKLGIVAKQAERWKESVEGLLRLKKLSPGKPPSDLKADLRPYQRTGFSWLRFLRTHKLGGVLADDMGLGKTVQTIALISASRKGKKADRPFLVIAPTSVVENWDQELEKFAPHLKKVILRRGDRSAQHKILPNVDVVVTSYALVHRDLEILKEVIFDTIILDEAQFVKNHQSRAYGAIRKLGAASKIALTGTPMENNLMELWSIFSIVSPGLFGSPEAFNELYRRPIEKHGRKDVLERLRSRIRPFIMRRKKELVAKELPSKTEQVLLLEMNGAHRSVYDTHLQRERQRVLGLLEEGGLKDHRFEILAALTKMRQMCLHPGLVDEKHADIAATKLEALMEQVPTLIAENHRVLIFSQFTGFLKKAAETLVRADIKYLYLDGSTKDRRSLVSEFQGGSGPSVFLISLRAGGFGLNLTAADYCILLDPWWNPAVESQAIDRAHRIGQHKKVFVYKMILKDSVEEKVLKLQEKKKQLFKNVLEDGDKFASLVTEAEIRGIFE